MNPEKQIIVEVLKHASNEFITTEQKNKIMDRCSGGNPVMGSLEFVLNVLTENNINE